MKISDRFEGMEYEEQLRRAAALLKKCEYLLIITGQRYASDINPIFAPLGPFQF